MLLALLQKTILKSETVTIPDGVTVTVKARKIVVKGPRGTLEKDLTHLPIDIQMEGEKTIRIERWFVSGKAPASIRTACSHIENMITGVTKVRPAMPPQPRARFSLQRQLVCAIPAHSSCNQ